MLHYHRPVFVRGLEYAAKVIEYRHVGEWEAIIMERCLCARPGLFHGHSVVLPLRYLGSQGHVEMTDVKGRLRYQHVTMG